MFDRFIEWLFDFGKCGMGVDSCLECEQLFDTCQGDADELKGVRNPDKTTEESKR